MINVLYRNRFILILNAHIFLNTEIELSVLKIMDSNFWIRESNLKCDKKHACRALQLVHDSQMSIPMLVRQQQVTKKIHTHAGGSQLQVELLTISAQSAIIAYTSRCDWVYVAHKQA